MKIESHFNFYPKAFIRTGCSSQKITLIYHSHLKQSDLQNKFQQFYKLSAKDHEFFNCFLKVVNHLKLIQNFITAVWPALTFNIKVESSKSFTIFIVEMEFKIKHWMTQDDFKVKGLGKTLIW